MRHSYMTASCVALCAAVLCGPTWASAGESDRWQALFAEVPSMPASITEARHAIDVRPVGGKIRVEVSDAGLRALQRNSDTLFAATAWKSAAQIRERLAYLEHDPQAVALAKRIDAVLGDAGAGKVPTMAELATLDGVIERELGPGAMPLGAPPPNEISAYRVELLRTEPRAGRFVQRLFEQQRRFAQWHADEDRAALERLRAGDAAALAVELAEAHHSLARQQLADAAALYGEARAALAPRVEHMLKLTRAAEAESATAAELSPGYSLVKSSIELLLTLQRETLQDVGFWIAVRPNFTGAPAGRLYQVEEFADIDLHGDGTIDTISAHYPPGRDFVIGLPPGIR